MSGEQGGVKTVGKSGMVFVSVREVEEKGKRAVLGVGLTGMLTLEWAGIIFGPKEIGWAWCVTWVCLLYLLKDPYGL